MSEAGHRPRDVMPNVAAWVNARAKEWGKEHVRQCITAAEAGQPGWFYAFEAGHVRGTPFDAATVNGLDCIQAAALGAKFFVVMRPPEASGGA